MSAHKPPTARNSHEGMAVRVTLHPVLELWLQQVDTVGGVAGVIAVVLIHGFRDQDDATIRLLASAILAANLAPMVSLAFRYVWSLTRSTFLRENFLSAMFGLVWLAGLLIIRLVNQFRGPEVLSTEGILLWSELAAMGRGAFELMRLTQQIAHARFNPALVLVGSFVALIGTGTLLLMLR